MRLRRNVCASFPSGVRERARLKTRFPGHSTYYEPITLDDFHYVRVLQVSGGYLFHTDLFAQRYSIITGRYAVTQSNLLVMFTYKLKPMCCNLIRTPDGGLPTVSLIVDISAAGCFINRLCIIETMEKVREFYTSSEFRYAPLVDGAIEGVLALRQLGFRLVIVTARSSSMKGLTENLVRVHFPGVSNFVECYARPKCGQYFGPRLL
jgi:hypothetical protein